MPLVTRGLLGTVGGLITRGLTPGVAAAQIGKRDYDIMLDVQSRLQSTDEFATVLIAGLPLDADLAALDFPMAVIAPSHWDELDDADDDADVRIHHKVTLYIEIYVRNDDRQLRIERLDRLANLASNAVDGQSLADITLPDMTKVVRASYTFNMRLGTVKSPNQTVLMTVNTEYFVDGFGNLDTTEEGW